MYKVIIVDDEKNICERMAKFLPWDEFDFEVVGTAKDGLAALDLVKSFEPDLVLSDIKMPNIDGIQLAEQLNRHYPDIVTVYSIGDVSHELCGGPHVKNTSELGHFKIIKEEYSHFFMKVFF